MATEEYEITSGDVATVSGNVVANTYNPRIDEDTLRDLTTMDEALILAQSLQGAEIADVADLLGTGFEVLNKEEKARLEGREFFLISWSFHPGDNGMFASAIAVVFDDKGGITERYIVNDGSTGIFAQLDKLSTRVHRFGNMWVRRGLKRSTYDTCPDCEKPRPQGVSPCPQPIGANGATCGSEKTTRTKGVTFYLDTSA